MKSGKKQQEIIKGARMASAVPVKTRRGDGALAVRVARSQYGLSLPMREATLRI
jgi:hypothetical protein